MHMISHDNVHPFAIPPALPAGGFLLFLSPGTAFDQHLDPAEVTNHEYYALMLATGWTAPEHWDGTAFPPGAGEEPVTLVTWYDARDYCAWRGSCLPRQASWHRQRGQKRVYMGELVHLC